MKNKTKKNPFKKDPAKTNIGFQNEISVEGKNNNEKENSPQKRTQKANTLSKKEDL